jgi:hypothetical protein
MWKLFSYLINLYNKVNKWFKEHVKDNDWEC